MKDNHALIAFNELFDSTPDVFQLEEHDQNGTGHFDPLVRRDLGLKVGERVKALDMANRRILVIRSHGSNIVLFERQPHLGSKYQQIAANMAWAEEQCIGSPQDSLTAFQINEAFELTQHSLTSQYFFEFESNYVDTATHIARLEYVKTIGSEYDPEWIDRKIDALKIQAAPSMRPNLAHVEAKPDKPTNSQRQTKVTYDTVAEVNRDLMAGNITPKEAVGCGVKHL